MGLISYAMLESKKKSLIKIKRPLIDRDHWDFLLWKTGIVIGFCGVIGIIIELIKYILDY
jgi:preprotein translocase subunit Sss1